MVRPVFIFHLPKTGGTAVFYTFRQAAGARHAVQLRTVRPESVAGRLERYTTATVFRAHLTPLIVPTPERFIRTAVLREPVERLLSHFCFMYRKRHTGPRDFAFLKSCPGYAHGQITAQDIVRWVREFGTDNYQTRILADYPAGAITSDIMKRARRALDSCDTVGVSEYLGHYMAILAGISGLKPSYPIVANQSSRKMLVSDPHTLRAALAPHNEWDTELYEIASGKFAALCAQHPAAADSPLLGPPWPLPASGIKDRLVTLVHSDPVELLHRAKDRAWSALNRARDPLRS